MTAAATEVPEILLKQLKIDGLMVIPVGKKVQKMYRIRRISENEYKTEKFLRFRFVPFLEGTNPEK